MAEESFWLVLVKTAVLVFVVITAFAYLLLWERKLIGRFQVRYGPNRTGPHGYMQPAADVVKLIFKEDFVPAGANRIVYSLAPMISVMAAVAAIAATAAATEIIGAIWKRSLLAPCGTKSSLKISFTTSASGWR